MPHAALATAALPFPVGAEIMHSDRPSSASVSLSSDANASSHDLARQMENMEDAARSTIINDHKHDGLLQKQGQTALLQLPKQQVRYENERIQNLNAIYVLYSRGHSKSKMLVTK